MLLRQSGFYNHRVTAARYADKDVVIALMNKHHIDYGKILSDEV